MRFTKEILKDYLVLLNKEKNLNYSDSDIQAKINDGYELDVLTQLLDEELYSVEEHNGQTISTERAFFLWCDIIHRTDVRTGRRIWNSFVKIQYNIVEKNKLICYMAHRGSGKSFFIALYVSFKMYLLPYFDVCYCSNVPRQKRRFLKQFRSLIDVNELCVKKKNIRAIANNQAAWGTEEVEYNDGILEGTTVGTTPRGGHYNLAIGDDPLRDDRKYTNEFIVNYFQGTLKPTTYTKKARYIIIGTPQDPEDLFHTLMNDKLDSQNRPIGNIVIDTISYAGFYSMIFPSITNEEKEEVLVPEIWTFDELMVEKKSIGDMRFQREMMCRCSSYTNTLIGLALFRSCCDEKLELMQKGEMGKKYILVIDTATSDEPTADYCAMSVWEDDQANDKLILRNLFHEKGVAMIDPDGGINDQPHIAQRLYKDFNEATVVVEKNNAGITLSQALQAMGIEVIEHYTHTSSAATKKKGKVDDVVDYVEQGLKTGVVVFPADPEDYFTVSTLESVKSEHQNYGAKKTSTGEKFQALSGHDDIIDTCIMAFKFRGDGVDTLPMAITVSGG